jgi:hypothetical protein
MSVAEYICYFMMIGPAIVLILSLVACAVYIIFGDVISLKVFSGFESLGGFCPKIFKR